MSTATGTEDAKKCNCKPGQLLKKLGLWPLPRSATQIATLGGKTSYILLSVNLFNPDIIAKVHPNTSLTTNILLGGAIIGGVVCWSNRPHLAQTVSGNCHNTLIFSVYNAAMNTFGSVLLWAMVRAVLPDKPILRTAVAIGASVTMLKISSMYVNHVDNLVAKPKE